MSTPTVSTSRFLLVCLTTLAIFVALGCWLNWTGREANVWRFLPVVGVAALLGLHFARARVPGGVASVRQSDEFVVANDLSAAAESARAALERLGARALRTHDGAATVVLEGRTRMSFWSFGEIVRIEIGPAGRDEIPVHVASRLWVPTTLVDYGKNLSNVRAVRDSMAR